MMLLGSGGAGVALQTATAFNDFLLPGSATCQYQLTSDGYANVIDQAGTSRVGVNWWTAAPQAGVGAGYEARWTPISGTPTGAAVNAWLALSSSRTWIFTSSIAGTNVVSGTVEIRPTSGSVIASCTVTLNVQGNT